ncbi:hypothetical protein HOLleu_20470 [Holothuria leucospilota]|uniref:Uncharacterized protein n=1 Tax=Holothuria leucospilota TaxID=206669 RepID=A0A9Q1H8H6_HOLLE|nr:hypothetical protein HOLleu_20470 [Holothuria leucospilota]
MFYNHVISLFVFSHVGETVTKLNFAEVFAGAWHEAAKPSIAVNGFRSGGLYPFNPSAYDKSKVLPGEALRPPPSSNLDLCEASETTPAVNNAVNHPGREAALCALEESLTDEKKWLFAKSFSKGYDLTSDVLNNTWKKLKENSNEPKVAEPSEDELPNSATNLPGPSSAPSPQTVPTPESVVSPAFDKYLRFPQTQAGKAKPKKATQLPKAISGSKFRAYLKSKQKEKEEEENRKQKNRENREAK